MIHFVGAGSGAVDLITIRGAELLKEADVIIYAGSLVNPDLLNYAKDSCEIYDSAKMTLDEIMEKMFEAEKENKMTVRLHTGDSSIYGAMIYMSQAWKVREAFIDIHGNNGSIDGDGPAAYRYTECRLTPLAQVMLKDINRNSVEMTLNYSDEDLEPQYYQPISLIYW